MGILLQSRLCSIIVLTCFDFFLPKRRDLGKNPSKENGLANELLRDLKEKEITSILKTTVGS